MTSAVLRTVKIRRPMAAPTSRKQPDRCRGAHCVKDNKVYTLSGDIVYNFMLTGTIFCRGAHCVPKKRVFYA